MIDGAGELTTVQITEITRALVGMPEFRSALHDLAEEFLSPMKTTFVTRDEARLLAVDALSGKLTNRVTRDEMASQIATAMGTVTAKFQQEISPLTLRTSELTGKLDAFLLVRQDAVEDVRKTQRGIVESQATITSNMSRLTEQVEQIHSEIWGDPDRPDDQPSLHRRMEKIERNVEALKQSKIDHAAMQPLIQFVAASKDAQEAAEAEVKIRQQIAEARRARIKALINPFVSMLSNRFAAGGLGALLAVLVKILTGG